MRPSQLRAGDQAFYSEGNGRPVSLEFVERIQSAGWGQPALNVFRSTDLGSLTLTDQQVIYRIKPGQEAVH